MKSYFPLIAGRFKFMDGHGKLRFIDTIGLLRDALPITVWFNDKELFPIR